MGAMPMRMELLPWISRRPPHRLLMLMLEELVMRKSVQIMAVLAASLSLGACATSSDRYGNRYSTNDNQLGRAAAGAAIGGAVGAGFGAAVDGVTPVEGAAVGAVAGAAIGAATANDRRWYRDSRGYCYYVDGRGDRIYDYNRGC